MKRWQQLIVMKTIVAAGIGFMSPAMAQTQQFYEVKGPADNEAYIQEVLERTFFVNTGRYYDIVSIDGQLRSLFGIGCCDNFPEGSYFDNLISRDARLIETLTWDLLQQQVDVKPTRTRDIPSPFNTSIMADPNRISP